MLATANSLRYFAEHSDADGQLRAALDIAAAAKKLLGPEELLSARVIEPLVALLQHNRTDAQAAAAYALAAACRFEEVQTEYVAAQGVTPLTKVLSDGEPEAQLAARNAKAAREAAAAKTRAATEAVREAAAAAEEAMVAKARAEEDARLLQASALAASLNASASGRHRGPHPMILLSKGRGGSTVVAEVISRFAHTDPTMIRKEILGHGREDPSRLALF